MFRVFGARCHLNGDADAAGSEQVPQCSGYYEPEKCRRRAKLFGKWV